MQKLLIFALSILLALVVGCTAQAPTNQTQQLPEKDKRIAGPEQQVEEQQSQIKIEKSISNDEEDKDEQDTESQETSEEADMSKVEVRGSISRWIPGNVDELADAIGRLVTGNLPFAKYAVSSAIKTALLAEVEINTEYTRPIEGENRFEARATMVFPLTIPIPLIDDKHYRVEVSIDFIIEGRKVVGWDIDFSSFNMREVDELRKEPGQAGEAVIIRVITLGEDNGIYRYRTILTETSGKEVNITALTREFIEVGYYWTGDRDFILDRVGSSILSANGKLEWETSFDLSESRSYFDEYGKVTYRECWYGTDSDGNAVGVCFSISTDRF